LLRWNVRALPKGKVRKPCEFGTKLRIDMTGEKYITNYQVYEGNPNDVTMLDDIIQDHKNIFAESFKNAGMDRGLSGFNQMAQDFCSFFRVHYYGGLVPPLWNINRAVVNNYKYIDILDVLLIAQFYVDLIDTFAGWSGIHKFVLRFNMHTQ
jgi:hypothetical protein